MYLWTHLWLTVFVGVGRFFGVTFIVASNKDVEGTGMGYPLPPPSMVCIPHRTRIVNTNSSPSRILPLHRQQHNPRPTTRILFLHFPQQRETRTPKKPSVRRLTRCRRSPNSITLQQHLSATSSPTPSRPSPTTEKNQPAS